MVKVGSSKMEQSGGINKGLKLKYIKRKASIKKKTMELATLCGINACMVCFGPDGEVETWPEDQSTVKAIIEMYKDQTGKKKPVQPMDMAMAMDMDGMMTVMAQPMDMAMDTDSMMMMMMEKKNKEDEDLGTGMSGDLLSGLSLESLKTFSGIVEMKLEAINARIKLQELVGTKQGIINTDQEIAASDSDHHLPYNYAMPVWGLPTNGIMYLSA